MLSFILSLFRKKRGCLYYKTAEEKNYFFSSLTKFATSDKVFFEEQYNDLLPKEKKEYTAWLRKDFEEKRMILSALYFIEQLQKSK